ncbi:MAG: aldehyde dehydrogenase family protein [bacterium]|nr:aldehyde dehydrogenase family protein [bacterium]
MKAVFDELGIKAVNSGACWGSAGWLPTEGRELITSHNPATGEPLAQVAQASEQDYETVTAKADEAFRKWRTVPAPIRGEMVRDMGNELRKHKDALGKLVTLEMGKIVQEGWGEVQEMIDICDFAVGQSRMLYGNSMHSERPGHRMYEQYHPLGIVGIISAFNFPVAVWAWNSALAAICGDASLWKPSSKTPLTGIAVQNIINPVMDRHGCPGIFSLVVGRGSVVGARLVNDKRIPLVSFTGSSYQGRKVGESVGGRFGRTILELGGNNAIIVTPNADLKLAIPAIAFGAVGTAGQRCTSTRRIIVHDSMRDTLVKKLLGAYKQVPIGDPIKEGTLMGPLVDTGAVQDMMNAIDRIKQEGGEVLCGGEKLEGDKYPGGCFVTPCIAAAKNEFKIVQEETFAPILYIITYKTLDEAVAIHNDVPQGLSSAIFTTNLLEAEQFLSSVGSDCGIANVNIGTSGAEIGGAFGGEKETGGGRESGSDAWKAYMRRQTNTINWSKDLPLAQGIKFYL